MKLLPTALLLATFLLPVHPIAGVTKPGKKTVIKGHLVDMTCVREAPESPGKLRTTHTKKCLQMPACEEGGYAVMDAEDHIFPFDDAGNQMAKRLIVSSQKEKDWQVVAHGRLMDDKLSVTKLTLR